MDKGVRVVSRIPTLRRDVRAKKLAHVVVKRKNATQNYPEPWADPEADQSGKNKYRADKSPDMN